MSSDTKSHRSVPMCPAEAMRAAAGFLSREWGENYRIGYAGWTNHEAQGVEVFQCRASDGSRFLIWADRWGNTGQFTPERESEVATVLDVETSAV